MKDEWWVHPIVSFYKHVHEALPYKAEVYLEGEDCEPDGLIQCLFPEAQTCLLVVTQNLVAITITRRDTTQHSDVLFFVDCCGVEIAFSCDYSVEAWEGTNLLPLIALEKFEVSKDEL